MNLPTLVDVAFGLSLVYLVASLFVTIVNEYLAQLLQRRAKQLRADLRKLIDGQEGIAALTANPAFAPLFREDRTDGSYIDPRVLAQQLVGGLCSTTAGLATMKDLVGAIQSMKDSNLKKQLLALSQVASDSVDKYIENVSAWIDKSLTMMGESYKKRTQTYSFIIGLTIAAVLNLDSLGIASHLYRDREAREALAALGSDFVQKTSKDMFEKCSKTLTLDDLHKEPECAGVKILVDGLQQRNDTFGKLPIGWPPASVGPFPIWMTVPFGWLLTALATSLGASFWFDLLNRIVNVRHGMRRPEFKKGDDQSAA